MTHVTYDRSACRVEITGHAGAGEAGHDPVCAAVSMLVYLLEAWTLGFDGAAELSEGSAVLSAPQEARTAFDVICLGFSLLQEEFPENIRYEIREEATGIDGMDH